MYKFYLLLSVLLMLTGCSHLNTPTTSHTSVNPYSLEAIDQQYTQSRGL